MQPVAVGPAGIITGASSGIGAACAVEFGRLGARLILASLPTPGLAQTVAAVERVGGSATAVEMDVRDPESGSAQVRVAGPDEADGVWLIRPPQSGGVATIAGHRGPVGFMLQVTFARPGTNDPAELTDLSARAEATARQAAADWTAWLSQQMSSRS